MAFNSVNQFSASHKSWDHVGNIIPPVEHSEGIRPHGEFWPAAWLPVQFFDKFYENWIVCMPGKLVALDTDSHLVPAQYGLAAATVSYTSDDVTAGTIDITTGDAVTAAKTVTLSDVDGSTYSYMGRTGVALTVSKPVGVAPYPYLQWAGDGSDLDDGFNPAGYKFHNYNMQHRAAILCDYVLELPWVPGKTTSETLSQGSYSSPKSTMSALSKLPVAKNTARTPITFANGTATDAATRFVREVTSTDLVRSQGDWHINVETGVVTVYASATISGNYLITYYNYDSTVTPSVSKFASVVGEVTPGCFLKCDSNSNWTVADTSTDKFDVCVGQVLDVEVFPKDYLDRVRTAYSSLNTSGTGSLPGSAGQMDQMPGTATGGVSDKIHYAGASNKVVRVNIIGR